jgi:hypothetical protein
MKSELILRKYKMNTNTNVIIKSKKMKDANVYINTLTLEFTTSDINPLKLDTRSAIQNYIDNIEMEDEQQDLFEGAEEAQVV